MLVRLCPVPKEVLEFLYAHQVYYAMALFICLSVRPFDCLSFPTQHFCHLIVGPSQNTIFWTISQKAW